MSARFPLASSLAALLLLAGCDSPPSQPPPLAGSALTGEFDLLDGAGARVTNRDFAGKYQLIYFGYTTCPNVCPFDMQRMMRGYDLFADEHPGLAGDIQPIFITVDPERDTPAKVAEYAAAFSEQLIGLTGTPAQIEAAEAAFFVTAVRVDGAADGEYDFQHSSIGYLVDRTGEPMAPIPVEQSAEAVAAELEKWVR